MRSWLVYLLSVPYINQKEIKLCKKLIYSYSTGLAFHMPGFYLLTILNYFIVALASGELSSIYFRDLSDETSTSNIKGEKLAVTFGSRTWVSIRSYGRMEAWAALSFKLSSLVCLLLFTFVLILALCSIEHAFEFRFVASSLAIVFVFALNCVCLHTLA